MFRSTVFAATLVAVLFTATAAGAAPLYPALTPAPSKGKVVPAVFQVQARVARTGKGWLEVEVTKVLKGEGLKVNDKIRLTESGRTKLMRAGKRVSQTEVKAGEIVEISGQIVKSGKKVSYRANAITILK